MATEAQRRARKKWSEKSRQAYTIWFQKKTDGDVIAILDSVENRTEFLRKAICREAQAEGLQYPAKAADTCIRLNDLEERLHE